MFRQLISTAIAVIILALMSCAPAGYQKTETDAAPTLAMATQTWQQASGAALPAVEDLMKQADAQIAIRNWDVASEKLERAPKQIRRVLFKWPNAATATPVTRLI